MYEFLQAAISMLFADEHSCPENIGAVSCLSVGLLTDRTFWFLCLRVSRNSLLFHVFLPTLARILYNCILHEYKYIMHVLFLSVFVYACSFVHLFFQSLQKNSRIASFEV